MLGSIRKFFKRESGVAATELALVTPVFLMLFLSMIEYPAVAQGTERIRLTCMATHTREDLETARDLLVELGREHGVIT